MRNCINHKVIHAILDSSIGWAQEGYSGGFALKKFPKITLVTPCFNHGAFVGRTIESVVSQGYPNLEYIVVNDASSDNSREVIGSYSGSISKIIDNPKLRPSPVFALNDAFSHSSGEILGWLSSDDVLTPNSLFVVAQLFADLPSVSWVSGNASTINSRDEMINSRVVRKNKLDYLNRHWQIIQQESTFFRRRLWEAAGGHLDQDFLQAFDTELWARFFERSELVHVDTPIGAFRRGSQSRSSRNLSEFESFNDVVLDRMRARASVQDRISAWVWRFLKTRLIASLLRPMPHRVLLWAFPKFSEPVAKYLSSSDLWVLERSSSFRRP